MHGIVPGMDRCRKRTPIGSSGASMAHDCLMHAVLRSLDSPALDPDTLDSYVPPIADDFGSLLTALIGPDEAEGEEVFYVSVCSPTWLARATMMENTKGYEFVRRRLVVDRSGPGAVPPRRLRLVFTHVQGPTGLEVATKLSRYLQWEFEDYTP